MEDQENPKPIIIYMMQDKANGERYLLTEDFSGSRPPYTITKLKGELENFSLSDFDDAFQDFLYEVTKDFDDELSEEDFKDLMKETTDTILSWRDIP